MKKAKVVFLGPPGAGKTAILKRYVDQCFDELAPNTTQAVFFMKEVNYGTSHYNLLLNDTAGQEKYHSLAPIYYKDADAAIIVYDITDESSLLSAESWIKELINNKDKRIPMILVGNKTDLERQRKVMIQDVCQLADTYEIQNLEVSAKSGENTSAIFEMIVSLLDHQNDPHTIQCKEECILPAKQDQQSLCC